MEKAGERGRKADKSFRSKFVQFSQKNKVRAAPQGAARTEDARNYALSKDGLKA